MKKRETEAFEQILLILNDIHGVNTIEWNYDIAFLGFKKYLTERVIDDFTLTIDKEGEISNTLNAAKKLGFHTAMEVDSKNSVGIRIADMLAGIIAKLLKSLHNALKYNSYDEQIQKKILKKEWFQLNQEQLGLYKKLYTIVCELNNTWHKSFSGRYSDDFVTFVALLNYMNHFSTVAEIKKQGIDMQGEYFNSYACKCLEGRFTRMSHKLPIDPIQADTEDYFLIRKAQKYSLMHNGNHY